MGEQQVSTVWYRSRPLAEFFRPLQGNIKAETAINTLNVFEGRLTRLLEEYDLVCRAKEALDLEHTKDDRLLPVTEELRDLKAVWTALSGIWSRLSQLRDTLWSAVQVRQSSAVITHAHTHTAS